MKRTYKIFTEPTEFCEFINSLSRGKRQYHVTPWASQSGAEAGFIVWYYG